MHDGIAGGAQRVGTQRVRALRMAAIGFALVLVLVLLAGRLWLIPARISLDPNEGWNAFQAERAMGAARLYPPPGSLTGNNYPPLSFFIVGSIGRMVGDNIVAGRIVALASLLVVSGLVFAAAREIMGRRNSGPTVGALIFLGFNVSIFRSYLCMDDPQWLGHALMTAGMFLFFAGDTRKPLESGRVVAAALLVLAGGFTKQNLVAFPLAATVWLAMHDRHALKIWILTSIVTLGIAGYLLQYAYGAAFFADLLASERHYSWVRMALRSAGPVVAMVPMMLVTGRLWKGRLWKGRLRKIRTLDRRIDLVLLMVVISVPLGIVQRSGQGVDRNAHFEALIALSLATAVSLERSGLAQDQAIPLRPLLWLLAPFLILLPAALHADGGELLHRGDREAAWSIMENRVAATTGRVACETSAICYWAGKPFEIDFFLYGQHVAIHHDAATLTRALAERRFAAIELDREPLRPPPGELANPLQTIIARSYRTVLVDEAGRRLLTP